MRYKIKTIEINGNTMYAVVKSWVGGLIEHPLMRVVRAASLQQAENIINKLVTSKRVNV